MAVVPETVKTEVDTLLDLIKKKKEISFEDTAKTLSISMQTIESWASFLEEEDLITIKYKFTTPYFIYKEGGKAENYSVSPFVLIDEISALLKEIPKDLKSKEFDKAKQKMMDIRTKMSNLPVEFSSEHMDLINSISEIENKMNELLITYSSKDPNAEERKGELDYLNKEFNKKISTLKKVAMHTNTRLDNPDDDSDDEDSEISKYTGKDIIKLITELNSHLQKLTEYRQSNQFSKIKQIYMQVIIKIRSLTDEIQDVCGIDKQTRKKIDSNISSTDQLMTLAEKHLAGNETAKFVYEMNRIEETLKGTLFVLRTIYEEKKLIEKKEILKSEVESIEPLLTKVYDYIKQGKFTEAKELYRDLEEKYVMLPTEFMEKKTALKKDLIKLNRDLALNIAEKSRIEFDAKSKAINHLVKQAIENLSRNEIGQAGPVYDKIETLFRELPEGFIDEKTIIQNTVLDLQEKLITKKKDIYFADLNYKYSKISELLSKIKSYITLKKPELAVPLYQEAREIYGILPEGFLEQKTSIQTKLLSIHRELLSLKTSLDVNDMNRKSSEINQLLIKATQLSVANDIKGASQLYDEIEDIYRTLPDGFLLKKTDLQNRILKISSDIAKRLDRISAVDMKKKSEQILQKMKIVKNYMDKGESDVALAEYEELVNLYNQIPPGFLEAKTRMRADILGLYRTIISSTDAFLVDNLDASSKEKYDEMLRLLVKMHQHIDAKEFQMLQSLYERITSLYNNLPVGFVQKKSKIINDIMNMYKKVHMYGLSMELQDLMKSRDFESIRKKLEEIYSIYNELIDKSFEDMQLFTFVYNKYFTYHRILLEERRIKHSILTNHIPGKIIKTMPTGRAGEIKSLRQRLSKAETHVSDLNFEFVKPIKKYHIDAQTAQMGRRR